MESKGNNLKNDAGGEKPKRKYVRKADKEPVKKKQTRVIVTENALYEAMRKCMGNISKACDMVECSRKTYHKYYNEKPEFKERIDSIGHENLDFAESKLLQRIGGYEHPETKVFMYQGKIVTKTVTKVEPPDITAIMYYLNNKGRERGYIRQHEIVNKKPLDPFEGMTEEEIDAAIAKMEEEEKKLGNAPKEEPETEE